mgnify:CR=1 FL=1
MSFPNASNTEEYGGLDTVVIENESLRVVVSPEKGADVLEIRDKKSDVNVLFEAPHNWQPVDGSYRPSRDTGTAWMDYYPGGWQDCLPFGGNDPAAAGAEYGIHGESSLLPWDYDVLEESDDAVAVRFSTELVRYPFAVDRTLRLDRGSSTLSVTESVENLGTVELPYAWLQHVAYGRPLLADGTRIDLDGATVTVDEAPQGESPLAEGESFEWPTNEDGHDMSRIENVDAGIHDLAYLHDLESGWYAVTNPDLDLGVAVSFDETLFESVWSWRALGGFESSPFFGRERVVGLELSTGWPATNPVEAQGEDGTETLNHLEAGETIETELAVTTYRGRGCVESYEQVAGE